MWRSQPPTAQPRMQFKPVSTQLLWLEWQLRWPVTRRLGSWQYNWDIRPKPMSTHWGLVTHICLSKPSHYWTLDNGLAPIQCQAMIWSDIHCLIKIFQLSFCCCRVINIRRHRPGVTWGPSIALNCENGTLGSATTESHQKVLILQRNYTISTTSRHGSHHIFTREIARW